MMRDDVYIITGGAGFIGVNVAEHYLKQGKEVVVIDDFSRKGSLINAKWLKDQFGNQVKIIEADICNVSPDIIKLIEKAFVVFHFAAQVAVTTSVINPSDDFRRNAYGTFCVLEAIRKSSKKPIFVYSSTNKVYGKMDCHNVVEGQTRYSYRALPYGVSEGQPLDFYSPYGCSKGTGDQYSIDYGRIYGLKTITFRQSCIYGPHQFGMEDQGWVAWFAIRALLSKPVVIYGDGKQVRDVLFVDDLIRAYDLAIENINITSGKVYNIGGGPNYTLSLLELIKMIEKKFGFRLKYTFDEWRPGDQKVYISDIRKAKKEFGWHPVVSPEEGVAKLIDWLKQNKNIFTKILK